MLDTDVLVIWLDLVDHADLDALLATLSSDERARVARLASPELRRRAAVRLARRREVLGELLEVSPSAVELATDASGRLAVQGAYGRHAVSSSSSGDVGLLAIAAGREIGVDVESVSEVVDSPRFMARVASSREAAALAELADAARPGALARLWTRKEAYLKATGEGIGNGVVHVEVPLEEGLWAAPCEPVRDGATWLLYDLVCPTPDLAAALVVEPDSTHLLELVIERR